MQALHHPLHQVPSVMEALLQTFLHSWQSLPLQKEELLNPEEKLLQIFENNRNDLIENKNDIKEKVEQQKACLRDDIINLKGK